MFGGYIQVSKEIGLLPLPHVYSNLSDCHDVVDFILDQTRSCARQGDIGCHKFANAFHSACQQSKIVATCILHKGKHTTALPDRLRLKVILEKISM